MSLGKILHFYFLSKRIKLDQTVVRCEEITLISQETSPGEPSEDEQMKNLNIIPDFTVLNGIH